MLFESSYEVRIFKISEGKTWRRFDPNKMAGKASCFNYEVRIMRETEDCQVDNANLHLIHDGYWHDAIFLGAFVALPRLSG